MAVLAETMFDGPFGSNLKTSDYTPSGTRVVRLENIGRLKFLAERETFISAEKAGDLTRHLLRPGDVLFSSFVDRETRVCVFPDRLPTAAINKADCFCVRVNRDLADPQFVALRLAAPETYETLGAVVHGATRPRIGLKALKDFQIALPPLAEQHRMVARIEVLFARARRVRADLERVAGASSEATRALGLLNRLENSILTRAFRGGFSRQDPSEQAREIPLGEPVYAESSPRRPRRRRATA